MGVQTVGDCLDNESVNPENGNAEQRTTGGLLVWRQVDNVAVFTDGGTTWLNGPNGLESRPNGERLSWENDPVGSVASAPPRPTPRPLPTLPVTTAGPIQAPVVGSGGGTIQSPYTSSAQLAAVPPPAGNAQTPPAPGAAAAPPPPGAPVAAGQTATPVPAASGTPAPGDGTLPPAPGAVAAAPPPAPAAPPAASAAPPAPGALPPAPGAAVPPAPGAPVGAAAAAATTTPTPKPTKTPTPKPTLSAKFSESPDEVETGNETKFEVETNAKAGACTLFITYRNSSEENLGARNIDKDGHCEWKGVLSADVRTGKAKARVTVASAEGGQTEFDETFTVKKGDTIYTGNLDLEIEPIDLPDEVKPGQEFKVGVDTNLKRKGSCALTTTWPKVGPVAGESQMPDDSGKCSWKVTVPADAPSKSTATLVVTVHKDGSTARTMTREFKIK